MQRQHFRMAAAFSHRPLLGRNDTFIYSCDQQVLMRPFASPRDSKIVIAPLNPVAVTGGQQTH